MARVTDKDEAPVRLTILRKGDTHIIDLAAVDPLIPRSETRVEKGFLDEICSEMERVALLYASGRFRSAAGVRPPEGQEASGLLGELQGLGRLIFSHLLTQSARERLKNVAPCDLYLRLDDQLVQVPWELCFDGEDFLATKFHMGRQVITQYASQRSEPFSYSPREKLRILIIADPTESLPGVTEEVEQLCTLLDGVPSVDITLLGGRGVRKIPLLSLMGRVDVVHFAGHSVFSPQEPRDSGWLLHEGVLTASEISKLDRPPLLVFSNSCQAGTTTGWQGKVRYEGEAFGLGSAFLLAGVRSFIGTFWPVHDAESLFFATTFYRSLTSGQTLGGALLKARLETVNERGWESLTWGSYMLYGDPSFRLLGPAPGSSQRKSEVADLSSREKPAVFSEKATDKTAEQTRWRLKGKNVIMAGVAVVMLLLGAGLYWYWAKVEPTPAVGPEKPVWGVEESGDEEPSRPEVSPGTETVEPKKPRAARPQVVKRSPAPEKERPVGGEEIPPPGDWRIRK